MKQSIKRIGAGLLALSLVTASPNPMSFEPTTVSAATQTKVFNKASTVKAGAYRSAKVLKHVKQGEAATVLQVKGSWTKVKVGTVTGWVAGNDLSAEVKEAYEAIEAFALKAGRSRAAKVVVNVPKGAKLERVAVYGSWSEVIYNGKRGFVANWSIRKQASEQLVNGKRVKGSDLIKVGQAYKAVNGKPLFTLHTSADYGDEILLLDVGEHDQISIQYENIGTTYVASIGSMVYGVYEKGPKAPEAAVRLKAIKAHSIQVGEIIYGKKTIQSRQFAQKFNALYDEMHKEVVKQGSKDYNIEKTGTFKIGNDKFTYTFMNRIIYIDFE